MKYFSNICFYEDAFGNLFFESQNKSRVNAEYKIKKQQESKLIIIHL